MGKGRRGLRHPHDHPITVHIDCAGTLGCLTNAADACHPRSPRAHWWRKIHAQWEAGDVDARKVKAHATQADVEAGKLTWAEKAGSDVADHYAKKGARLHMPLKKTFGSTRLAALSRANKPGGQQTLA